jgi:hypothetical protein
LLRKKRLRGILLFSGLTWTPYKSRVFSADFFEFGAWADQRRQVQARATLGGVGITVSAFLTVGLTGPKIFAPQQRPGI